MREGSGGQESVREGKGVKWREGEGRGSDTGGGSEECRRRSNGGVGIVSQVENGHVTRGGPAGLFLFLLLLLLFFLRAFLLSFSL